MEQHLRAGIVGGGIGGLCLAHALEAQGIAVTVFEQDVSPTFRQQGYRVTIHESGARHLKNVLPAPLYQEFLDRSYRWKGLRLVDERLRSLATLDETQIASRSIDRMTFRQILLSGLADLRFAKAFDRYEEIGDKVRVHLADGSHEDVDFLVGADGNNSRLRAQLLPAHAELHDTGYVDIAARLPWSAQTQRIIEALDARSLLAVSPPTQETLIILPQIYDGPSEDPYKGYLYWGLVLRRDRLLALTEKLKDGSELKRAAQHLVREMAPRLREMVDTTPSDGINLLSFRTSRRHAPWQTSRVTLIGDAIHSMAPMAGAGANTAIRDADELASRLRKVKAGDRSLHDALSEFETTMVAYGFDAVEFSQANLLRSTTGSRFSRRFKNNALKLLSTFSPRLVTKMLLQGSV